MVTTISRYVTVKHVNRLVESLTSHVCYSNSSIRPCCDISIVLDSDREGLRSFNIIIFSDRDIDTLTVIVRFESNIGYCSGVVDALCEGGREIVSV